MRLNDYVCETLSVLIHSVVWETASSQRQCSQFCGSSLLGAEVALWSCCHSSCLWCIFLINYLNSIHTISSPIMQHLSIKCQQFSPLIKWIQSVASLLSVTSLRRSQCSPGLTTWWTRSCWTWFLCSRASAKRKMFTVSYRVWGTGSRRRLALPASAFGAQRRHLAAMAASCPSLRAWSLSGA